MGRHPAWKKAEERVAAFFGRRRTPLSGVNSGHTGADVIDDDFYIEVKRTKRQHVAMTLLRKTREEAHDEEDKPFTSSNKVYHKIPVVALQEPHHEGFGILIHSSDVIAFAKMILKRKGKDADSR